MRIKLLCAQWGYEHLDHGSFAERVKADGYDGIDTWVPEGKKERLHLLRYLEDFDLAFVAHQFRAQGSHIGAYCRDFEYHLNQAMELQPLQINSHSGFDWFTLDQQLAVLDTAAEFEVKNNVRVLHETHRGRMGFSPTSFYELAVRRTNMRITADFSHWVCVTESYLQGFGNILSLAMERCSHIHARVGFPQGPQVLDPRLPQYREAWEYFTEWWTEILARAYARGDQVFTVTPEFGPPPYMWTGADHMPLADQWNINLYVLQWFRSLAESVNARHAGQQRTV